MCRTAYVDTLDSDSPPQLTGEYHQRAVHNDTGSDHQVRRAADWSALSARCFEILIIATVVAMHSISSILVPWDDVHSFRTDHNVCVE